MLPRLALSFTASLLVRASSTHVTYVFHGIAKRAKSLTGAMAFSPRASSPDASTSQNSASREGGEERRSQSSSTTTSTSDARTNGAPPLPGFRRGVHLYDTTNTAKAHRCNDRLEDVVQGLFEGNPLLTVPPAWKLFTQCLRSAEGEEPQDPFLYHTPKWLEAQRAREREKNRRGWFSGGGGGS